MLTGISRLRWRREDAIIQSTSQLIWAGGSMKALAEVFKALSNETRLTIMGLIFRHGPLCVCEVEQLLGITQPKASRHLRYLRDAGVLEDERDGLLVNYGLPRSPGGDLAGILVVLRGLLANRPIPEAVPMLAQIREGRAEGRSAVDSLAERPAVA
jgi:ArsR family transcriptional regulator, arsenate/arsenite/antimonite-responsive transcriptional repressor